MKQKKQQGFSLLEVILYLGLLSLVLLMLASFFQEEIFLKGKVNDKIETTDNGQFALNKIVAYIQQAELANIPAAGQTSETLSLNMPDTSLNPLLVYLENGILKLKPGNFEPIDLTNSRVKVTKLSFTDNSFAGKNPVIQINLQLESVSQFWKNSAVNLQTSIKIGK